MKLFSIMKTPKFLRLSLTAAIIFVYQFANSQAPAPNKYVKNNVIQVALLLDVSGSMSGLLDQAKTEIWNIVNEAAKAKKQQVNSKIEIALYEYGNGYSGENNYIRRIMDFSSDLDTISKNLFSLKTSGSDEYCGEVILKSLDELQWRESDSVYKVIFIAGNEPFTQGPVDYKSSTDKAKTKHVIVNTIHCGDEQTGINSNWQSGAISGLGKFFCINQNAVTASINTPYDAIIDSLNTKLNGTYLTYGIRGREYKTNQIIQDNNMKSISKEGYMSRAKAKSNSKAYYNGTWDAVDAVTADSTALNKIITEGIDTSYHVTNAVDLKKLIDSFATRRIEIQKSIAENAALRDIYIAKYNKEHATIKDETLGNALIKAMHEQAIARGFEFN